MPTESTDEITRFLAHAKDHFRQIGVAKYRTKFISSGFGDILTNCNFAALLSELVGLEFDGATFATTFSRHYYSELLEELRLKVGESITDHHCLELTADDLSTSGLAMLQNRILGIESPVPRAVCFGPKTPSSFAALHNYSPAVDGFLNNGFRRWFLQQISCLDWRVDTDKSLTFHLRLGDVAAVRIHDAVVIPVFIRRPQHPAGFVKYSALSKNPFVYKEYRIVDECIAVARELKRRHPGLAINLVSDGFDRAKFLLMLPDTQSKLKKLGIEYDEGDINAFAASVLGKIEGAHCFNKIVFGESNTNDFFQTVRIMLNSDTIVSTARSFVFNILAFFPRQKQQIEFYSPLSGGIFNTLDALGIKQRNFQDFKSFLAGY